MKIFGIWNITPDSFSGSGDWEGADVIDIGAESTRPGATPISVEEEIKRLEPIFPTLARPISLDTRNPQTAKEFAAKVKYLNDVSGFNNPDMVAIAAENNLTAIAMHSLTIPADLKITIQGDAVEEIMNWSEKKFGQLQKAGIGKIILDPGLGFGKTPEQNWKIIHNIKEITQHVHNLGAEILVGHSRKSFLSQLPPKERDIITAEVSVSLQEAGVDYIRVHNVKLNRRVISHPHS